MRPTETLIAAWHVYHRAVKKTEGMTIKSRAMFKHASHDHALYNRASELYVESLRFREQADVDFRKALKQEWCKRYRIVWKDSQTCTVWVRTQYDHTETALVFNKSLRARKKAV